jgi:hypothetical protein
MKLPSAGLLLKCVALMGAALVSLPALAEESPPIGGPVNAVWTPKTYTFTYQGFTAHYSCDGLRDKMRVILLRLGARSDISVQSRGCGGREQVTDFPGVAIKMNVLAPVGGTTVVEAGMQPVTAQWQEVSLTYGKDPLNVAGDCELIEQVKQFILPLFATKNVAYKSFCVPNQLIIGGTSLSAYVLKGPQKVAGGAGAAP